MRIAPIGKILAGQGFDFFQLHEITLAHQTMIRSSEKFFSSESCLIFSDWRECGNAGMRERLLGNLIVSPFRHD
jgi:hypothetical protein